MPPRRRGVAHFDFLIKAGAHTIGLECSEHADAQTTTKNEEERRRERCLVVAATAMSPAPAAAGERCSSRKRSPTYSPAAALDLLAITIMSNAALMRQLHEHHRKHARAHMRVYLGLSKR